MKLNQSELVKLLNAIQNLKKPKDENEVATVSIITSKPGIQSQNISFELKSVVYYDEKGQWFDWEIDISEKPQIYVQTSYSDSIAPK